MRNIEETSKVSIETGVGGSPLSDQVETEDPVISNEARQVLEVIFYAFFSCAVSVFGSVANVINIIVFIKQGFSDAVNISLCGLAVADLCSLLPLFWMSVCYNPLLQYSNTGFLSDQMQYLTAAWPHTCFLWITGWITVFITFERCVCIALPMKVKDIVTPRRTFVTIVLIFICALGICLPMFFYVHGATYVYIHHNYTLVELYSAGGDSTLKQMSYSINIMEQLGSVVIVIILTVILICQLQAKSDWRLKAVAVTSSSKYRSVSQRDKRVVAMVALISCIYIACYLPTAANCVVAVLCAPDYDVAGRYRNVYMVSWAIVTPIESLNSAVSTVVYYNMSSNFRASFNKLLG